MYGAALVSVEIDGYLVALHIPPFDSRTSDCNANS
jgi:hypothetical protein